MKNPIVQLKTRHAAMVADKNSSEDEILALEKEIAEAEENAGLTTEKAVKKVKKTK